MQLKVNRCQQKKKYTFFFISLFPSHRRVCLQKPLKLNFFSLHFLTMQWEDNIETRCGVRQPRPGKYSFQIGFPIFFLSAGLYSYTERRNFGEGMPATHRKLLSALEGNRVHIKSIPPPGKQPWVEYCDTCLSLSRITSMPSWIVLLFNLIYLGDMHIQYYWELVGIGVTKLGWIYNESLRKSRRLHNYLSWVNCGCSCWVVLGINTLG